MSDLALRQAERSGDQVTALAHRIRHGELDPARAAFAAALGHRAAQSLVELGVLERVERPDGMTDAAQQGTTLLGRVESVRWAADLAQSVVDAYWTGDVLVAGPAQAIFAARAWADRPCEERAEEARRVYSQLWAWQTARWSVRAGATWRAGICVARASAASAAAACGASAWGTHAPDKAAPIWVAEAGDSAAYAVSLVVWATDPSKNAYAAHWHTLLADLAARLAGDSSCPTAAIQ